MHGLSEQEEIDYWREQTRQLIADRDQLRSALSSSRAECEELRKLLRESVQLAEDGWRALQDDYHHAHRKRIDEICTTAGIELENK